jgi:MFS transporter, UMF1 family
VAPPASGGGLYGSAPSALGAYAPLGSLIGLAAGQLQAASRTLLVRLAPRDRVTQPFGLLVLPGKLTSFLGPLLVATLAAALPARRPAWRS